VRVALRVEHRRVVLVVREAAEARGKALPARNVHANLRAIRSGSVQSSLVFVPSLSWQMLVLKRELAAEKDRIDMALLSY
jgi:hypothetical protein